MSYCTVEYYLDDYMGADPDNDVILRKAILRATEIVDVLTQYKLVDTIEGGYKSFDSLRPFIQQQVKKAVATLAEHWIIKGGYDSVKQEDGIQEGYIGEFRFTQDTQANSIENIPETVFALLSTTGLLHAEIHSGRNDGLYFTGWFL
jgi:hypothetical protein